MTSNGVKFKLEAVLWAVLAAAVLAEGWFLYNALRPPAEFFTESAISPAEAQSLGAIDFDLDEVRKIEAWRRTAESYEPQAYTLTQGEQGRANPFAEY